MIKENTPMLLCRVYDYKFNDFIAKHIEVLEKYNEVWMLKSGKTIGLNMMDLLPSHWLISDVVSSRFLDSSVSS